MITEFLTPLLEFTGLTVIGLLLLLILLVLIFRG